MRRLTFSALFLMLFSFMMAGSLAAQTIVVTPNPIVFQLQSGASATQTIGVSVSPATAWTIAAFTGNTSFLSANKISDTQATVTVNTSGVDPQKVPTSYVVVQAGSAQPFFVPVNVSISSVAASQVSVSTGSLTFTAQQGSTSVASQVFTVGSTSATPVSYSVSATSAYNWLTASPASGNTASGNVVTVGVTPGSLAVGGYDGTITVTPTGVANPVPVQVSVHMDVTGAPQIALDKTALSFPWQIGTAAPATQIIHVTVANSTSPAIVYASVDTQNSDLAGAWLVISGTSGALTPADIQVSINSAILNTLAPKKYTGRILISAPSLSSTPTAVPITFTVSQLPIALVTPASLQFTMPASGGQLPASQKFTVASTSTQLGYTVTFSSPSGSWLTLNPAISVTTSDIQVSLNSNAQTLPVGTYTGTITVSPTNGSDAQTVAVSLKVLDTPALTTSPGSLTYVYQIGKALPVNQLLAIGSTGAAQTFTAAATTQSGGGWLALYSGVGVIAPTDILTSGGTISVGVNAAALTAGTYQGQITLTAQNSTAPVTVIPVTLQVSSNPLLIIAPAEMSFSFQPGGMTSDTKYIAVNSTSDTLSYTVSSIVNNGFGWLLTGSSGATPSNVPVFVNTSGLAAGIYTGSVTITPANGGPAQTIPVKVTVTAGALAVSPGTLTFTQVANGAAAASQQLTITNGASGGGTLPFSATVSAGSPGGWLSIDKTSGNTPGSLTVTVAGGLNVGTYTGSITISSPGAANSPQTIGVTLNVTPQQTIALSSSSLSFTGNSVVLPIAQTVALTATQAQPMSFTAAATTSGSSSVNWLAVTPASGTVSSATPVGLTVSIVTTELAKLAPGAYTGFVTVTAAGASNSPQTVAVTLTVPSVSIIVPTNTLSFSGTPAQTPASQSVSLQSSAQGISFKAVASTTSGGNWLAVTPTDGTMPATLTVSIVQSVLAGLQPGMYNGSVTITSPNTTNSPQTIPVVLTVGSSAPVIGKVVNGASYLSTPISAGEILYIQGTDMGPADLQLGKANPAFPTTLSEVRVLFDGIPAPIIYVQKTQISVVAPWFLNAQVSTNVQVEYKGQRSDAKAMRIGVTAPGIFALDSTGTGQGAILNEDSSLNGTGSGQRPVVKGSVIQVYGTGGGVTSPAGNDGALTPAVLTPQLANTTAVIGGLPARVLYAGAAPGLISGLMQVNIEIPADAPSGAVPVVILVGGTPTQANITVAIR